MKKESRESIPKKVFHFAYAMNFVVQAGVSMVCPAGLIILGGLLLHKRLGLGKWVVAAAIIIGILIGFYSMFYFVIKTIKTYDPTQSSDKGGTRNGRSSGSAGKHSSGEAGNKHG